MVTDVRSRLGISDEALTAFCRKWKITRLEVFGSALREDFDPEKSDIDLLATFSDDDDWSFLDQVNMEFELEELTGREVDLIERAAVAEGSNRSRRDRILNSAIAIYAG